MRIDLLGLSPDGSELQDYLATWEHQRAVHARVVAGEEDRLLLLEHAAVYTAGKLTQPHERPADGTPVVDVDRGGKITWHGPGQLVGYPIVQLARALDVVRYVRTLEEALIRSCAELGVETMRVKGRSGVWCAATTDRPERKIAAIGIRVAQRTTMHGFALNCCCDLAWSQVIIPCGIDDAGVTSLTLETGRTVTPVEMAPIVARHLQDVYEPVPRD